VVVLDDLPSEIEAGANSRQADVQVAEAAHDPCFQEVPEAQERLVLIGAILRAPQRLLLGASPVTVMEGWYQARSWHVAGTGSMPCQRVELRLFINYRT
jgi:hypothetical protein